jgi:CubicO group peptidase (beta-lactamase class C family)
MSSLSRRLPAIALLLVIPLGRSLAQSPQQPSLVEFEGLYDYRDGGTLLMIATGDRLVAVIGEAKYTLRRTGADAFANPSGDPIPFVRGIDGRVSAFREHGDTFARRSTDVPAAARLLLEPRPRNANGGPVAYLYRRPVERGDGIRAATAEPASLRVATAERLVNGVIAGTYADVRSILVHRHGALRLEEYFYGYDADRPHQMRSLTKSVIALLAGIAIDRGLLTLDAPAIERLGYGAVEQPDPRKARITLGDLLSNQSGLACDDHDGASPGSETKLYDSADWVKAFVDLPMVADPGTVGRYCSFGFLTAGRIVERAVGQSLPDFAQAALFAPLGMTRTDWRWTFTLDRSQRNEFGQIYLRPRDMLKLGLLIHHGGAWEGRRVVSASWIEAATARRSRVDDSDYGLGIWHRWYNVETPHGARRVDTVMLSGNGGQKVFVVPSLDLVVVFTGGAFNVESPTNEIMARVLLPALLEPAADAGGQ